MWSEALDELTNLYTSGELSEREVTEWRARIYLGRGWYDDVMRITDPVRHKSWNVEVPLALAHAKQGRFDAALHIAQQAVQRRQNGAEQAMGAIYAEMGNYNCALLWYERASGRLLERAQAMRAIGRILMKIGDYGEARFAFEEAIRHLNYRHVDDLKQLAACLRKLGRERDAYEVEQLAGEQSKPAHMTAVA